MCKTQWNSVKFSDSVKKSLSLTFPNVLYRIKIILLWRQYNKISPEYSSFIAQIFVFFPLPPACWLSQNDVMCDGISSDYILHRRKHYNLFREKDWENPQFKCCLIQNWWNVKVVLKHKTLLDNVFDCIGSVLPLLSHSHVRRKFFPSSYSLPKQ